MDPTKTASPTPLEPITMTPAARDALIEELDSVMDQIMAVPGLDSRLLGRSPG